MHSMPMRPRLAMPCAPCSSSGSPLNSCSRLSTPAGRYDARRVQQRWQGPSLVSSGRSFPSVDTSFLEPAPEPREVTPYVRSTPPSSSPPSVTSSGSLRPDDEWFPAWMKYRRREDNLVFWKDKFQRSSLNIPDAEKRWTLFSTFWWLLMDIKYFAVPPALRFVWYMAWRAVMDSVYRGHKALVLWQCKLDAWLAARGSAGKVTSFWRPMALRRLHWRHTLLAEMLYMVNVYKTGRVWMMPPVKQPWKRPTFFFLF